MSLAHQLTFLFSALGAINGVLLSAYFLLIKPDKRLSDYFLGGLLLMLSIRIIKSVFLHFNPQLFQLFVQFGVAACMFIGPFLFLYVRSMAKPSHQLRRRWWWYLAPWVITVGWLSFRYPYTGPPNSWGPFVELIYKQWFVFILAAAYQLRNVLPKLWRKHEKLSKQEEWLLQIFGGVTLVYLAYETSSYTSYIVGAISFSFIFYTSVLLWIFQRNRRPIASDPPLKYANSSLGPATAKAHLRQLEDLMAADKTYLDPELTLAKLSKRLEIPRKELSQAINQVAETNYSRYIAELRVAEAKRLLLSPDHQHLKIAAIAYESGFNSLSSFNATFKDFTGFTPHQYQKER